MAQPKQGLQKKNLQNTNQHKASLKNQNLRNENPKEKSRAGQKKEDFTRPLSFREESIESVLQRATRISDLKNLGPASESALQSAGINNIDQFIKLGWIEVMKMLVAHNPRNRHSIFAYAIIGAEKNLFWNKISEADKVAARSLMAELKPMKNSNRKRKK